jgi:hypothetical protein
LTKSAENVLTGSTLIPTEIAWSKERIPHISPAGLTKGALEGWGVRETVSNKRSANPGHSFGTHSIWILAHAQEAIEQELTSKIITRWLRIWLRPRQLRAIEDTHYFPLFYSTIKIQITVVPTDAVVQFKVNPLTVLAVTQ